MNHKNRPYLHIFLFFAPMSLFVMGHSKKVKTLFYSKVKTDQVSQVSQSRPMFKKISKCHISANSSWIFMKLET